MEKTTVGNCFRCLEVVCNLCETDLCDHLHDDPDEWEPLLFGYDPHSVEMIPTRINSNLFKLHQHMALDVMGVSSGKVHHEVVCESFTVSINDIPSLIDLLYRALAQGESNDKAE